MNLFSERNVPLDRNVTLSEEGWIFLSSSSYRSVFYPPKPFKRATVLCADVKFRF